MSESFAEPPKDEQVYLCVPVPMSLSGTVTRCTRFGGAFSRPSCWPQILKWLSNNIEDIPLEVLQDACRQQAEYEARCADHVCAVPWPDVGSMLRLTCAVSWRIADNEASPSSPESPRAKPRRESVRLLTVVICPTDGHCWKCLARRTALWHTCCPGQIVLPDRMHADHHCHDWALCKDCSEPQAAVRKAIHPWALIDRAGSGQCVYGVRW
jgi:hypothetical protein